MTIDNWFFSLPHKHRAVYRIVVNEKWFYYGSSVDLRRRLSVWKHKFSTGNLSKNRSMLFIFPEITTVRFEIIENVDNDTDPKILEDKYIKQYHKDPLCLNISFDSFRSVKNGKLAYGVKLKEKVVSTYVVPKKKIAHFNGSELIAIYESVCATVRATGIKDTQLSKLLKGKRGLYRGNLDFKEVSKDGEIIDHPTFKPKPHQGFNISKPNPPKPVVQMDKNGTEIKVYENCRIAAKEIGVSHRYLWSIITQKKWGKNARLGKTAKGFMWKYA